MKLNKKSLEQWRKDRGDFTLMLDHHISKNSTVIDIGAYTGVWISQMISKYDCNYYALEPIEEFYNTLAKKFEKQEKVKCIMAGISPHNESRKINISGDATSVFGSGQEREIILYDFQTFLKMQNIEQVDLVQINIEGMEYELLKSWIFSGVLNKINKILIQFHYIDDIDVEKERRNIQNHLSKSGFKNCFNYPFVWEAWERIR
jgi:FkbM family methyltransferase